MVLKEGPHLRSSLPRSGGTNRVHASVKNQLLHLLAKQRPPAARTGSQLNKQLHSQVLADLKVLCSQQEAGLRLDCSPAGGRQDVHLLLLLLLHLQGLADPSQVHGGHHRGHRTCSVSSTGLETQPAAHGPSAGRRRHTLQFPQPGRWSGTGAESPQSQTAVTLIKPQSLVEMNPGAS